MMLFVQRKQSKRNKNTSTRPNRKTRIGGEVKVIEGSFPPYGKMYFSLFALAVIVAGIVFPIVVQTHMAQRAFEIRQYQIQLNEINAELSVQNVELMKIQSPSSLESKAKALGMKPSNASIPISIERGIIGFDN